MAKVIFSMTAGLPHGDDYTQPTGDTPISLGEVDGKAYFSIDDGNTTITTDGANDSVYGVSVVSDADEKATLKASSNYVKDGLEDLDRKFMEDKSMVDLLADVADDTSATKTAIADHKAAKAAFLSNLGF
tara:strand:+ start:35476 stop:35865 length:390 start_codon:yes stop_codon:yes gene_type:complete